MQSKKSCGARTKEMEDIKIIIVACVAIGFIGGMIFMCAVNRQIDKNFMRNAREKSLLRAKYSAVPTEINTVVKTKKHLSLVVNNNIQNY